MSAYTFSANDWPAANQDGNTVYYKPDVSSPPVLRGVLRASSRGEPLVHWAALRTQSFLSNTFLNYVAYSIREQIPADKIENVQASLEMAFKLAFPLRDPAKVKIMSTNAYGKRHNITFKTTSDNVLSTEIVAAASFYGWNANGQPLVNPLHVDHPTTEALLPIRFEDVPSDCKEAFIESLPEYLTTKLDPVRAIEVVDLWEEEARGWGRSEWRFNGRIVALVCASSESPHSSLCRMVPAWPGWYHFNEEHLIRLEYPGRFKFCEFCLHTAQGLSGPNKRHSSNACPKITCRICGHPGHNAGSDKPDPDGKNKKACEEGKKRRLQEKEEARKRQKIAEEKKAAEEAAAKKKAEEEEAARRKAAEEEEARTKAAEEETDTPPQSEVPGSDAEQPKDAAQDDEVASDHDKENEEHGAQSACEDVGDHEEENANKTQDRTAESEAEIKVEESL